jgi:hypothetical protein
MPYGRGSCVVCMEMREAACENTRGVGTGEMAYSAALWTRLVAPT